MDPKQTIADPMSTLVDLSRVAENDQVGHRRIELHVGHVDLILFLYFVLALAAQRKDGFWWHMSFNPFQTANANMVHICTGTINVSYQHTINKSFRFFFQSNLLIKCLLKPMYNIFAKMILLVNLQYLQHSYAVFLLQIKFCPYFGMCNIHARYIRT